MTVYIIQDAKSLAILGVFSNKAKARIFQKAYKVMQDKLTILTKETVR